MATTSPEVIQIQARLTRVVAAIDALISDAQVVRFRDREVRKADLGELRSLEQQLRLQLAAAQARAARMGRNRVSYVAI